MPLVSCSLSVAASPHQQGAMLALSFVAISDHTSGDAQYSAFVEDYFYHVLKRMSICGIWLNIHIVGSLCEHCESIDSFPFHLLLENTEFKGFVVPGMVHFDSQCFLSTLATSFVYNSSASTLTIASPVGESGSEIPSIPDQPSRVRASACYGSRFAFSDEVAN
jgi:hypothetical protein